MVFKIGLMGYPGSGKDETFKTIRRIAPSAIRLAFGDKVREELADTFNMSVDEFTSLPKEQDNPRLALIHSNSLPYREIAVSYSALPLDVVLQTPRSPRYHLRMWATEYRRNLVSDGYWVRFVMHDIREIALNAPDTPIVITDVRHYVEIDALEAEGFQLWRIDNDRVAPMSDHSSELDWPNVGPTDVIGNNGTLDDLHKIVTDKLQRLIDRHKHPRGRSTQQHS